MADYNPKEAQITPAEDGYDLYEWPDGFKVYINMPKPPFETLNLTNVYMMTENVRPYTPKEGEMFSVTLDLDRDNHTKTPLTDK